MPDSSSEKVLRSESAGSRTWRTCFEPNPRSEVSGGAHAAIPMTRTTSPVTLTSRGDTALACHNRPDIVRHPSRDLFGGTARASCPFYPGSERAVDAQRGQDQPQVGGGRSVRRAHVLDQLAVVGDVRDIQEKLHDEAIEDERPLGAQVDLI